VGLAAGGGVNLLGLLAALEGLGLGTAVRGPIVVGGGLGGHGGSPCTMWHCRLAHTEPPLLPSADTRLLVVFPPF